MNSKPLIDTHQHVIPDIYRASLARVGIFGSGENPWPDWSVARMLELMDQMGIDGVMTSIASPGAYFGDIEFTKTVVRQSNEAMAALVGERPRKFGALALVSLPDVEAAIREVDYALDTLKLDGINLLSHTGDRYLGHPDENELYAELDRRNAVVFVHPVRAPQGGMAQFSFPAGYTELVFDTTRAIVNLLFNGTLAKYPNVRFVVSHAGGVIPYLLFRVSGMDHDKKIRERIPNGVTAYLKQLYYDIAQSAAPLSLRALLEVADSSRIVFGTDYPSARNVEKVMKDTVEAIDTFDGFDESLRHKVRYENALALYPRFAHLATY